MPLALLVLLLILLLLLLLLLIASREEDDPDGDGTTDDDDDDDARYTRNSTGVPGLLVAAPATVCRESSERAREQGERDGS